jgi:hypothetical protein
VLRICVECCFFVLIYYAALAALPDDDDEEVHAEAEFISDDFVHISSGMLDGALRFSPL